MNKKSIRLYLFQAPSDAKALYQHEDFSQAEMTPVKEILVSIGRISAGSVGDMKFINSNQKMLFF